MDRATTIGRFPAMAPLIAGDPRPPDVKAALPNMPKMPDTSNMAPVIINIGETSIKGLLATPDAIKQLKEAMRQAAFGQTVAPMRGSGY